MSCCRFAIETDTGKTVAITQLERHGKRKKGAYVCYDSDCRSYVFARLGPVKAHHFAHYSLTAQTGCKGKTNGESEEHIICKHWVARNSKYLMLGKQECPRCNAIVYEGIGEGWESEVEARVPGCKRTVDVMLSKIDKTGEISRLAVEIFHTHATDDDKYDELHKHGIKSCVELTTEDIMQFNENPTAVCHISTYNRRYEWCDECIQCERRAEAHRIHAEIRRQKEKEMARLYELQLEAQRKREQERQAEEQKIKQQEALQQAEEDEIKQQERQAEEEKIKQQEALQQAEEDEIKQQEALQQAEEDEIKQQEAQQEAQKKRDILREKYNQLNKEKIRKTKLRAVSKKKNDLLKKQTEFKDSMDKLKDAAENRDAITKQGFKLVIEHRKTIIDAKEQGMSGQKTTQKCKACHGQNWTHKEEMHEIKRNKFHVSEWNQMHAYHMGADAAYVLFCDACSIECSSCRESSQLDKVEQSGMCLYCYDSISQKIAHLNTRNLRLRKF